MAREENQAKLGLDSSAFARGLAGAEGVARNFKHKVEENFSAVGKSIAEIFTVGAVVETAHKLGEMVETIKRTSEALGVSTDFFQTFSAAARNNGSSVEEATKGLEKLSIKIGEARDGNEEAEASFAKLGISLIDQTGKAKSTEQVLRDVANVLSQTEDGTERARIAMDLFGKSGVHLLATLQGGSASLDEFANSARLSAQEIDEIAKAKDNIAEGINAVTVALGHVVGWFARFASTVGIASTKLDSFSKIVAFLKKAMSSPGGLVGGFGALLGESSVEADEIAKRQEEAAKAKEEAAKRDGATAEGLAKKAERAAEKHIEQQDAALALEKRQNEELQKRFQLLDKLVSAEKRNAQAKERLATAKEDRTRFTLQELANLDEADLGRRGSENANIAAQILDLRETAKFAQLEGNTDYAKQLLYESDNLADRLKDTLASSEFNQFKPLEDAVLESNDALNEIRDSLDEAGIVVRKIVNSA